MDEDLILKWNNTVSKADKVFHLGDFGFGSKDHMSRIVSRLNGKISIILGNHDGHSVAWHRDVGFAEVSKYPIIYDGEFILSHKPFFPLSAVLSDEPTPFINIFGHIHNRDIFPPIGKNYACVSVENIGYRPVFFDTLKKQIKKARELNVQQ